MFTVRKVIAFVYYCPRGHDPLPDPWPRPKHSVWFCPICGLPLEEMRLYYDAACCTDCNHHVEPSWNYCTYCGRGREDRGGLKSYKRYQRLIDLVLFIPLMIYPSYQMLRHPSYYRCPQNRRGHLWIVKEGKVECKFCQQPLWRVAPDAREAFKEKEWYERWQVALLVLAWGMVMSGLGFVVGKFVF